MVEHQGAATPEQDTGEEALTSGPDRLLRVLEFIVSADLPPSQREIADALGIPKSTLSVLLRSLLQVDCLVTSGRGYVAGRRLLDLAQRLGKTDWQHTRLGQLVLPVLQTLALDCGETITLSVEIGGSRAVPGWIRAIATADSPNPIRFVPSVGETLPIVGTAAGRAILAFSGRSVHRVPVPRSGVAGIRTIDREALEEDGRVIRKRGYAVTLPSAAEFAAIAAPVFDADHWPVAAISAYGPSYRFNQPDVFWPAIREATAIAGQRLIEEKSY